MRTRRPVTLNCCVVCSGMPITAVMVGGGEMRAYGNMCMGLRRTIRDGVAKFGRARTKYEEGERFMLS